MAKPKQKKGKGKKRVKDPLLQQAIDEAAVRYGPEKRALGELLSEARQDLKTSISAEKGAAAGIQAAADNALPQLQQAYTKAGAQAQQADTDVQSALAGLGPGATPYKAVAAREAGAAKTRVAEAMGDAEKEIHSRKIGAEHGRAFAVRSQTAQYQQNKKKINRQKVELGGDVGTFIQATYRDLTSAKSKQDLEQARLDESIRASLADEGMAEANLGLRGEEGDRAAAKDKRDARRDATQRKRGTGPYAPPGGAKGGKPKFTPVQLRDARAQWGKGKTLVRGLKKDRKEGDGYVKFLTEKGVHEPVARGVVQTHILGGVRPEQRRKLQVNYGLKPKVYRPRKRGGIWDSVGGAVENIVGR